MHFQNQIMGRGVEIIVSDVITVCMVYLFYSFVYFSFPRTLFFREILGLQQNWERGTEISHKPLPKIHEFLPHDQYYPPIFYQGHFLPRMNFTLTCNNHPYSIMYLRTHSWCYIFCGFGQNIITYSYHYNIIQNIFTVLKILCCIYSSLLISLETLMFFYCLHSFSFSRMTYHWNHTIWKLFILYESRDITLPQRSI